MRGQRHRVEGPAIVYPGGSCAWYLNGERHRIGGPAVEAADGAKAWYVQGALHREDGPALLGSDGTTEWYLHGVQCSEDTIMARKRIAQMAHRRKPVKTIHSQIFQMRKKYLFGGSEGGTAKGPKPKF